MQAGVHNFSISYLCQYLILLSRDCFSVSCLYVTNHVVNILLKIGKEQNLIPVYVHLLHCVASSPKSLIAH